MTRSTLGAAAFWGLLLAVVTGLTLQDRAAFRAAVAAWEEKGERPPAPPASSGNTRGLQREDRL